MAPHPGGLLDHLPGHNSAYRRDQLLALGKGARACDRVEVPQSHFRNGGNKDAGSGSNLVPAFTT